MLDIAACGSNGNVTLRDAAQRQGISEKYLWQLAGPLKAAGLIRASRGAHGGYVLVRPASQITLLDIFEALEGSCSLVGCVAAPDTCSHRSACAAQAVWTEIGGKLAAAMKAISLEDVVEKQRALTENSPPTYNI
jgi:Rrf2 family protein